MRMVKFFMIFLCGIPSQLFAQRYYGPEVPRYEFGLQADIHHLDGVGEWGGGLGFRFNYNFNEHVALDSELIFRQHDLVSSGLTSQSAVVGQTTGLFGIRAGKRVEDYGFFAHARAGFLHFGTDRGVTLLTRDTVPAFDVRGSLEHYYGPVILRIELGELIVAYGNAQAVSNVSLGPPPSPGRVGTRASPVVGLGFAVRF
ncbi:MAG TPA: hypothetical protein VJN89_08260 [Candidatus Acidoferrum sp.]|nr:hypothetical protein [Candidatus Acidoferrum sp.]